MNEELARELQQTCADIAHDHETSAFSDEDTLKEWIYLTCRAVFENGRQLERQRIETLLKKRGWTDEDLRGASK